MVTVNKNNITRLYFLHTGEWKLIVAISTQKNLAERVK